MCGSTAGERSWPMMLRRLTEGLILVGTASLVYWPTVHRGPVIVPLRAELPFAIALVLGAIAALWQRRGGAGEPLFADAEARWTWIALAALLGACVLATGLSWFRYHLWFNALGRETLLKLILNLLVLALIYRALRTNAGLFQNLALAVFLSTLVPLGLGLLIIADPHIHAFLTGVLRLPPLVSGGVRFQGLTSNPVMQTFESLTGIAFFLILALCALAAGAWRMIGLASVVGGMGLLVLWSQTRSALIALVCLIAMAVIAGIRVLRRGIGRQALLMVLIALVTFFGWRLLPSISPEVHPQTVLGTRLAEGLQAGQRLPIYGYYWGLVPSNPLGVGFNYTQKFVVKVTTEEEAAHSSIFELWMFGGGVAVLAAGAVLVFAGVRAARELRAMVRREGPAGVTDVSYLAAAIALLSYWIEMTFIGSPFNEMINSVLLAMVLAGIPRGAPEARGGPIDVLSGRIAWFGYLILLGLGLRAVLR